MFELAKLHTGSAAPIILNVHAVLAAIAELRGSYAKRRSTQVMKAVRACTDCPENDSFLSPRGAKSLAR